MFNLIIFSQGLFNSLLFKLIRDNVVISVFNEVLGKKYIELFLCYMFILKFFYQIV